MAYPTTGNPTLEALIDGTWTDLSTRVRAENGLPGISITRGRANEQGRVSAQRADLTLNNGDGVLSNRNPLSPYFGLLPRNTQVRVAAGTGDTFLRPFAGHVPEDADRVYVTDVAALDVTGDIEIRVDLDMASWKPNAPVVLATKYLQTGDQRSWALVMSTNGILTFYWSTAGTNATARGLASTASVNATSGRVAIKVTLDVNNGAGGCTAAFYQASSIDGSYTQIGSNVVGAGTTSIFASTARLVAGASDDFGFLFSGYRPAFGRFYGLRVYSGIAGSVVANADFSAQTWGATSFVDSAGRTWNIGGRNRITSDRIRFWGELSSMPQRWDPTGTDVYVKAVASGALRRLGQGSIPLKSPLYRALTSRAFTGYWPLEDGSDATSGSSAVPGSAAATLTAVTLGNTSSIPGTASCAEFSSTSGRFVGAPKPTTATGTAYFAWYFKLPSLPGSASNLITLSSTGTARRITVEVGATTYRFTFYDAGGTQLDQLNIVWGGPGSPADGPHGLNITMTTNGSNVDWIGRWHDVTGTNFVSTGTRSFAGSVGRFTGVDISAAASSAFSGAEFAHVQLSDQNLGFLDYDLAAASNAYTGETACERLERLGAEVGVPVEPQGNQGASEAMGPQGLRTVTDLMYECADADRGLLAEARDALALTYVTRIEMESRRDFEVDYSLKHLVGTVDPTEDDQGVVNDVTVRRSGGGSGRYEVTSGPMSVSDPPDGIGRYDTDITLSLEDDTRLETIAEWIANVGSVDEARIPSLSVALHRSAITSSATLLDSLIRAEVGNTMTLSGLPSWLPPDDVYLLVQGYREELGKFLWTLTFNLSPAWVYNVGKYDEDTKVGVSRYDHASSTVGTAIDDNDVTMSVALNSVTEHTEDLWTTDSGDFPFDIMVGGEQMTVTNITGSSDPQSFTVTRSVNGVVKSHAVGTNVRLYLPVHWGS
jgi:hypothetical protein